MAMILMDRHTGTESPTYTSVYNLFSDLERILMTRHHVLRMPSHRSWSKASIETWLSEYALNVDLFIGSDFHIIQFLRKKGWKGKVIYNILGDLPHGASGLRNALPFLHKTDAIWCACTADKEIYDILVEQNGYQPEVIMIPYGINCESYTSLSQTDRDHLRSTWNLTPEDFVVVYAGRFTVEKNFHSILEVIYHLVGSGERLKFLVAAKVDDIPFRQFNMRATNLGEKIHHIVERLNLTSYVRFVPWLDQTHVNELYNIGDAFVNLTLAQGENLGYAQIEAMSAGLPVVATAWGGLKDTIIDGQTGFLADTWVTDYGIRYDMPKVVNALRLLINKPALRKELSNFATYHARKHYSLLVYSSRFLEAIDSMLTRVNVASQACYTEFGTAFHSRFSVTSKLHEESVAISPVYMGLSDPFYSRLIKPYTSLKRIDFKPESELFAALAGRVEGNFFISNDLLWPVRIRLNHQEAQVIHLLSRYITMNSVAFTYPNETIQTLIQKGLVGISNGAL